MSYARTARSFIIIAAALLLTACSGKAAPPMTQPPIPVLAADAAQKDVPVEIRAIGNVEAYSTVNVKSLIAGEITKVGFNEGQEVKKGQLLFTIDQRPLLTQLKQAEANLARDTVSAANADVEAKRYGELVGRGMVSKEQADQFRTQADSLNGTVDADKALIDGVKVQLGYTKIYSPLDGLTGSLGVNEGNVVKANDTPYLVVINQTRPIYVTFSIPEGDLPAVRKRMREGGLKVEARIKGDDGASPVGTVSFIDNAVDVNTGTIKLKATFDNADKRLWPGQFVDTVMTLSTVKAATTVPSQAVQTGQQGQFIFIIKPDLSVEQREVTTGVEYKGETVVEKGIAPGEKVVTDGQLRLIPGSKVEVKAGL